jgi:hypothetical protein
VSSDVASSDVASCVVANCVVASCYVANCMGIKFKTLFFDFDKFFVFDVYPNPHGSADKIFCF